MKIVKTIKLMNKEGSVYEKEINSDFVKTWLASGEWEILEERNYEVKKHRTAHSLIQEELHLFRQRMNKQVSYVVLGHARIEEIYSYLKTEKTQDGFENFLYSGVKVLLNKENPMFVGVC